MGVIKPYLFIWLFQTFLTLQKQMLDQLIHIYNKTKNLNLNQPNRNLLMRGLDSIALYPKFKQISFFFF